MAPRRTILETHNASQKSDPQRAENDATVIRVLEKSAVDTSPLVNRCGQLSAATAADVLLSAFQCQRLRTQFFGQGVKPRRKTSVLAV
jgi:hypothetical protein